MQTEGPNVVTLGGGHGQAALLAALCELHCQRTAVVSVADDGGCSGRLREELGMPPPGDVRRCLSALAAPSFAGVLEARIDLGPGNRGRSVGNLVLGELCASLGSLTLASLALGRLLGAEGYVLPVADQAGTLAVFDGEMGSLRGESQIERASMRALVARVAGPERATSQALAAIAAADLVLFGPGSFVGSTLAVLTTGDVGRALAQSRARLVLVRNIAQDEHTGVPGAVAYDDHERFLRDHLTIASGGEQLPFDVLLHADQIGTSERADRSIAYAAPLADNSGKRHQHDRLVTSLAVHWGLKRRAPPSEAVDPAVLAEIARLRRSCEGRLRQPA